MDRKLLIKIFFISLVLALFSIVGLQIIGHQLITEKAPMGIVSFEMAGDQISANEIVGSWDEKSKIYAGLDLGLDYFFLVFYSTLLATGSLLLASGPLKTVTFFRSGGFVFALASFIAGFLDAIENYALIKILIGNGSDFYAKLAFVCAVPKFILVIGTILFILLGCVITFYLWVTEKNAAIP